MSSLFHVGHVAQLHEIQEARLRHNQPGIGLEVEELIARLTSGGVAGKSDDPRVVQVKRLWDLGVGRELGIPDFEAYLVTIPAIPEAFLTEDSHFPHLVLVDPRLGLAKLCALGNIAFSGDDNTFVPWDDECKDPTSPVWIWMQDGRKNRNSSVSDCRTSFAPDECGLTALEGVSSFLQCPTAIEELRNNPNGHAMDLGGSVRRDYRESAAYLCVDDGRAELCWNWDGNANPRYGSASRRSAKS